MSLIPDAPTPPEREPVPELSTQPAGWYPQGDVLRWWDGSAWTTHTHNLVQTPPPMPRVAVTTAPKRTNHTFHLLMTVFTCGLWGFVWLAMILVNKMSKDRSVTHYR